VQEARHKSYLWYDPIDLKSPEGKSTETESRLVLPGAQAEMSIRSFIGGRKKSSITIL
jgi:hypothetical protein